MKLAWPQIGAVLVVAAMVVGWQQVRINRLQDERAAARNAPPKPAEARPVRILPQLAGNKAKDGGAVADKGKPATAEAAGTAAGTRAPAGLDMEKVQEMMKNPAMRGLMAQQMKTMASTLYKPLVEKLSFTDEERDHFLRLISDTLVAQQDQGMAMISAKTPDARAAVEKQVQEGVAEQKRKIREFLNDEADFQAYEAYAGTLSERQQLLGLKPVLEAGGNPLTGDQEERLVEAMHRARTTSMPAAEWGDGSVPGEAVFADDAAERLDRALTKMNESVLNETASILDENQQKAFADYQEQMKNMQKIGIEMARTMFQAKPAEKK